MDDGAVLTSIEFSLLGLAIHLDQIRPSFGTFDRNRIETAFFFFLGVTKLKFIFRHFVIFSESLFRPNGNYCQLKKLLPGSVLFSIRFSKDALFFLSPSHPSPPSLSLVVCEPWFASLLLFRFFLCLCAPFFCPRFPSFLRQRFTLN